MGCARVAAVVVARVTAYTGYTLNRFRCSHTSALGVLLGSTLPLACGAPAPLSRAAGAPAEPLGSAQGITACRPEVARCSSYDEAEICRPDGSGWDSHRCDSNKLCLGGRCVPLTVGSGDI